MSRCVDMMQSTMHDRTSTPMPHGPLVELRQVDVDFGRQHGAARHRPVGAARPDAGRHRRERLRQDGAAEDDHRPAAARRAARCSSTARTWPQLSERELTRQRIRFGFLFQQAALFDSMTIAQNVAFPLRQHTATERRTRFSEIVLARLAEVGLPENIVAQEAGRAFRRHAEAGGPGPGAGPGARRSMLYDEPTTGLDPIMSDVINELILGTRQQHPVTSIVVTHDMHTAQKVADRVVMLYPLQPAGAGRAADHLRRPAGRDRRLERSPRVAVRPRRGRRAADGNAKNGGSSTGN